jgi:hypothetical protein
MLRLPLALALVADAANINPSIGRNFLPINVSRPVKWKVVNHPHDLIARIRKKSRSCVGVLLPLLFIVATNKEDDRYLLSRHRRAVNATNMLSCRDGQQRTQEKADDSIFHEPVRARLTPELTDAGGQWCPNWKLTRPARVRSSDLVRPGFHLRDSWINSSCDSRDDGTAGILRDKQSACPEAISETS